MFNYILLAYSILTTLVILLNVSAISKKIKAIYFIFCKAEKLNAVMGQALQSIEPLAGTVCNNINFIDKRTLALVNQFDDTINNISKHNEEYLAFLANLQEQKKAEQQRLREEQEKKAYEELENKQREMQYLKNKQAFEANKNYDSENYVGNHTKEECPMCGYYLIQNQLGQKWCPSCTYGLETVYFEDENADWVENSAEKEIRSKELISEMMKEKVKEKIKQTYAEEPDTEIIEEFQPQRQPQRNILQEIFVNQKDVEEKDTIQR